MLTKGEVELRVGNGAKVAAAEDRSHDSYLLEKVNLRCPEKILGTYQRKHKQR